MRNEAGRFFNIHMKELRMDPIQVEDLTPITDMCFISHTPMKQ